MSKPYRILSLDGGGIRGIVPALILADLEERTGQKVAELFDLIAGTSTGGILALALTRVKPETGEPATAKELVALYEKEGSEIFKQNLWRRVPGAGVLEEKYPHKGLEGVAEAYLGETSLSEAITPVVITAYALERRMPFFFKSRTAVAKKATHDFPMKKVARATSAAPTYFEPLKLEAEGDDYYSLVDGGVFANNPAMCALAEALSEGIQLEDIVLVSLGTGEHTRPIPHDDAKNWGLARWAVPIIGVMMDGVSDTVAYQASQILAQGRYFRIQGRLTDAMDDMDDASTSNVRALRLFGEGLIRANKDELEAAAKLLVPGEGGDD